MIHWTHLRPEIWIVDNASTDDSVQIITDQCPHVHLVRNLDNLGFAGGTNRGIVQALAMGDSPILLLNNDAFISEEDICELLMTLRQETHVGVVGPLIFDALDQSHLLSAGGKNPVLHHYPRWDQVPNRKVVFPVDYVLGTAALVRAEVFRQVGLLDEEYFFIAEFADFCQRVRQHGYTTVTNARSRAFHDLGRSLHYRDTLYVYYTVRNRFLFIRKFYPGLRIPLTVFWGVYSLALALRLQVGRRALTARSVRLGLVDGLRGRFGGQNERVLAALAG